MKKLIAIAMLLWAQPAFAASQHGLQPSDLSLWWAIPFAGVLLSLAIFPLAAPKIWHHHYGKISAIWAGLIAVPLTLSYGIQISSYELLHTMLLEYIPFIIVITTLYTVSGGIKIVCDFPGTPAVNTALMTIATIAASLIGTTGAAMLFIRPLIMMNSARKQKTHLIIFFIFLVGNIGGCLTALGDPPLFLGFLNGIDFFWPLFNLYKPFLVISIPLLLLFYMSDSYLAKKDTAVVEKTNKLQIKGTVNFWLLLVIMAAIVMSGNWRPGSINILNVEVQLQNIIRDIILVFVTLASLKFTPRRYREYNMFNWDPVIEVAKIFAAIFITAVPLIAILKAGSSGALGFIVDMVTVDGQPANNMYFFLTGALSAFLDNAPTYLVFFHMAGGDPVTLMGTLSTTLMAISCGAVFMGAITYIGNAPNFMIKAIAETNAIPMPSFFGYMAWSLGILLPLFIVVSFIYF